MREDTILVFGRSGQLARELDRLGERTMRRIICIGRETCDLADGADPAAALDSVRPVAVINAAAYTAVDKAESDEEAAFKLNRDAAGAIAMACAQRGVPFVHVSTDYVFDGTKGEPYTEGDPRAPLGIYGRSKAAGEDAVMEAQGASTVARTAWLWSVFGANFPKTMLRLAVGRDELGVVSDQRGRPTNAGVAAAALVKIADRLAAGDSAAEGLFHLSNTGDATWAEFAEAVLQLSGRRGGPTARVRPITTADYPTPARRPADSRLNASRLEALLGAPFPHWRDSLEAEMDELTPSRGAPL